MGRARARNRAVTCSTGKDLHLERGLAEIEFDSRRAVILQGPAGLELVSASAPAPQGHPDGPGAGRAHGVHRSDPAQQGCRPRYRVRPIGR